MISRQVDCLVGRMLFYIPLEDGEVFTTYDRHLLGVYSLFPGRDLYRATPAVT